MDINYLLNLDERFLTFAQPYQIAMLAGTANANVLTYGRFNMNPPTDALWSNTGTTPIVSVGVWKRKSLQIEKAWAGTISMFFEKASTIAHDALYSGKSVRIVDGGTLCSADEWIKQRYQQYLPIWLLDEPLLIDSANQFANGLLHRYLQVLTTRSIDELVQMIESNQMRA